MLFNTSSFYNDKYYFVMSIAVISMAQYWGAWVISNSCITFP